LHNTNKIEAKVIKKTNKTDCKKINMNILLALLVTNHVVNIKGGGI